MRTVTNDWRNDDIDTVILNPIVIRNESAGFLPLSNESLDLSVQVLNESFAYTSIYFQYCGEPRILDSDEFFNLTIEEAEKLNSQVHQDNTINLYIAETVSQVYPNGDVGLFCGIASFPQPEHHERYILMVGSCITDDAALLAHEIGHFYGLYHTHESSFGSELVRRLNCEIAGDLLCDTPADPLLNISNVVDCRYLGDEVDPEGETFRPDTKNIMSYAPESCRSIFSFQQLARMMGVQKNENRYLKTNCNFPDFSIMIDTSFASFLPGQRIMLPIVISNTGWPDTYGLLVKVFLSDDPNKKINLLKTTSILYPPNRSSLSFRLEVEFPIDLPESIQYIIAEVDGDQDIAELNENNNKSTLAYTLDYSQLTDMSVYPNPVESVARIFLRGEEEVGHVNIEIFDLHGRKVKSQLHVKSYNTFQAEVDVSDLNSGLYILVIWINGKKKYMLKLLKG